MIVAPSERVSPLINQVALNFKINHETALGAAIPDYIPSSLLKVVTRASGGHTVLGLLVSPFRLLQQGLLLVLGAQVGENGLDGPLAGHSLHPLVMAAALVGRSFVVE